MITEERKKPESAKLKFIRYFRSIFFTEFFTAFFTGDFNFDDIKTVKIFGG